MKKELNRLNRLFASTTETSPIDIWMTDRSMPSCLVCWIDVNIYEDFQITRKQTDAEMLVAFRKQAQDHLNTYFDKLETRLQETP